MEYARIPAYRKKCRVYFIITCAFLTFCLMFSHFFPPKYMHVNADGDCVLTIEQSNGYPAVFFFFFF